MRYLALLKEFHKHTLYLIRSTFRFKAKEITYVRRPDQLTAPEQLLGALHEYVPEKVSHFPSFDNSDMQLSVPGSNLEEMLDLLQYVVTTIEAGHTVTTSKVARTMRVYDDTKFFVTKQGDYVERLEGLRLIKSALTVYAEFIQRHMAKQKPSRTDSHNSTIARETIQSLLKWLERVRYE